MNMHLLPSNPLYRSTTHCMSTGVAGGLAQYFNIDPVLVRLAFVLLGLSGGIGLIAYLILAIVVPERPLGQPEPVITSTLETSRGRAVAGFALLGFGLLFLAANFGLFRLFEWGRWWPLLLIGAGALILINRSRDQSSTY